MSEWTVELPASDPLTANHRKHRMRAAAETAEWRAAAFAEARRLDIPACDHVTVQLVSTPPNNRRRDPSNLMPTQKAAIDGALVDAGVVTDDCADYVTELVPRIEAATGDERDRVLGRWRHRLVIHT